MLYPLSYGGSLVRISTPERLSELTTPSYQCRERRYCRGFLWTHGGRKKCWESLGNVGKQSLSVRTPKRLVLQGKTQYLQGF